MKQLLALAAIAFVIWNAYRSPDSADYLYPLSGESQRYAVKISAPQGTLEGGATIRNDDLVDIDGTEYQKFVFTTDGIPGMEKKTSYMRAAKDGIYSRSSTKVRIPEYLDLPLPPEVGKKWTYAVEGERMEGEIVAIESLATPDKVYYHCVKVLSKGTLKGSPVQSTSYYAPKVGMVKSTIVVAGATVEMTAKE
ncbi:MAG: hypothetical protein ACAH88_10655 [Roseimicrobium sp.]